MNEFSNIKYKNSFLNNVIIRIDFLQFQKTSRISSDEITKSIIEYFPQKGKTQLIRYNDINIYINENIANPNTDKTTTEGIQQDYFDLTGKNKIVISNKFVALEIGEYSRYEEHIKQLKTILPTIFRTTSATSERTGIRYINLINAEKVKLQKNFFTPEISATLNTKPNDLEEDIKCVRSMHLAEYRVENMILNFRYGMYNPEYPNILKTNSFALDLDCFCIEPIDSTDEILRCLDRGHNAIQSIFENSISDSLRVVMGYE